MAECPVVAMEKKTKHSGYKRFVTSYIMFEQPKCIQEAYVVRMSRSVSEITVSSCLTFHIFQISTSVPKSAENSNALVTYGIRILSAQKSAEYS